jgi:peptide/nickel transport system permease protein
MTRFLIRRIIQSAFLLLAIMAISFLLMRLSPGGPIRFLIGSEDPNNPKIAEQIRELETRLGLNEPIPIQFAKWVWGVIRFDFGFSLVGGGRSVVALVWDAAVNTFIFTLGGTIIGLLGIPLGVYAAKRRGSLIDNIIRIMTVVINAVPHWWLGLILIIIIANITINTGFKLLPLGGMNTVGKNDLLDRLWHLILPSFLLSLTPLIVFARFARSQTLEVLNQDYVRTANAKGMAAKTVNRAHVLRNSLIPLVTIFGGLLPGLFSGAVLTESVMSWPGMGTLYLSSALQRDYPVLMGIVLFLTVLIILGNLLADVAYGFVDPRVRYD